MQLKQTYIMKITEYIINKGRHYGISHFMGIPGDFAIPFFADMDTIGIEPIIFAHEPSLGYAADAYARINGLSVIFVTYGAGGLNALNSIAQAYAEDSPVIVVSGAPELDTQRKDLLVHHKVKSFKTQLNIYKEVTCIAKQINNIETATHIIDEVFETVKNESKPGYIEIPRDLIKTLLPNQKEIKQDTLISTTKLKTNEALFEVKDELEKKLHQSKQPVILAGNEIARKGLKTELTNLVNNYKIPYMTTMSGKSVLDETNPYCLGTYMGKMGDIETFNALKKSDLILILGTKETDMDTGLFSAKANQSAIVHAVNGELRVGFHKYSNITLKETISVLNSINPNINWQHPTKPVKQQKIFKEEGVITTNNTINLINQLSIENNLRFILDVGDMMFNSVKIKANDIISPSYYASMGFAVPASIASTLSDSYKRTIAFVGDGAFQMTGLELGVIKRYNLNPIIVLMNNSRYETMCVIDEDRKIYDTPDIDYCLIAKAAGIYSEKVNNITSLKDAIQNALTKNEAVFIEAIVSRETKSEISIKLRKTIKQNMEKSLT